MQPITPIRFPVERYRDVGPSVAYGHSAYITACNRFYVYRIEDIWIVGNNAYHNNHHPTLPRFVWEKWLTYAGLIDCRFSTRREALAALWYGLTTDDLAASIDHADINQTQLTPVERTQLRL